MSPLKKTKKATQTITGKAFEYALLKAFFDRLVDKTVVQIVESEPYNTAYQCFHSIEERDQTSDMLAASFAVNLLIDLEPRLYKSMEQEDVLQLELLPDKAGEDGDVRDVLAIRSAQNWEIGVSAKHNHRAVKHPRLSATIDFGEKWLGKPCSCTYMDEMKRIFEPLAKRQKESNRRALWTELGDYQTNIYVPVLNAFIEEIKRLTRRYPGEIATSLAKYLIGREDFYKVIKQKDKVEVQAYNLHGTLNQSADTIKPKTKISQLKLPKRILDISFEEGKQTTILVTMDEGWQMSFRIHNASSRIEPSLKFDINLISSPHTLFVNKLFLPVE